jgi:hypothetical protein
MMHDLNGSVLERCGTLRYFSAYCKDQTPVISYSDRRRNWVIVCSNVLQAIIIIRLQIPGWPIIQNSLLHLKPIGICKENTVIRDVFAAEFNNEFVSIHDYLREADQVKVVFDDRHAVE